jgi:DnaK suppressor protein
MARRKDSYALLRQILVKRRDALRKALAGDLTKLNQINDQAAGDLLDAALDSAHNEISSQLAEVESRELASIEYALERMRTGQFGLCERCGQRIPLARLNALPYATSCIECQREMEREGTASAMPIDFGRVLEAGDGDLDLSINDLEIDVS